MSKTHSLKLGLLATAVFGVSLAACSDKDDAPAARSKTYQLAAKNGQTAEVVATENADSSFNLKISLTKSTKDTIYHFNVIKGSIGTPTTDTLFKLGTFKSTATGSTVTVTKNNIKLVTLPGQTGEKKFTLDSLAKYQSFAIIAFKRPGAEDSVAAKGNMYQPQ